MSRGNINDILAFLAVAKEQSFTHAAAKLGVSHSALSHTIRQLEERLGLRLLTRTTRSVSPTEAGARLLRNVGPRLDEIEAAIEAMGELRERPAGTIRISAGDHPIETFLCPMLEKFLPKYPDINVELSMDNGLTDIAAQGFDAGARLGENVARDMIAVRIGPDLRFAAVGSRSYCARHSRPQTPQDLVNYTCINLRLQTSCGIGLGISRRMIAS
jgi:DNA-binding transcriptional LysR family regulator